jgi:hypothetical protein
MEVSEAYELVNAPFVILDAYEEAERTILEKCATDNQRSLYAQLNPRFKQGFLKALVRRVLFTCVLGNNVV